MTVTSLDDLERLAEGAGLYLAGAFGALARLGRRSPELAAVAVAEGQALVDALTPDPQPTRHWSHGVEQACISPLLPAPRPGACVDAAARAKR